MTDKTQEQIKELSELAKPIQKFLLENYYPYYNITITPDDVQLFESQIRIPLSS